MNYKRICDFRLHDKPFFILDLFTGGLYKFPYSNRKYKETRTPSEKETRKELTRELFRIPPL